ncbi:MAG: 50S ribosomal protein L25 [Candidatus Jorgensenbacteria bacterium]
MELKAKNRNVLGKKVKRLRKEGVIPAEIFGHGVENKHVSFDEKLFKDVYKKAGGHTIVQVLTEDGLRIPALISEVQIHPLTRQPLSVLIKGVRADEKIEIKVPIEFKGKAPAEKSGFVVVMVLDEIEIEALPDKIPHSFEVDLSNLNEKGQSIHVSDLKVPDGVKILQSGDMVVVIVTEREKEEAAASPAAETAASEGGEPLASLDASRSGRPKESGRETAKEEIKET